MKKFLEILIATLAGVIFLILYVKIGANNVVMDYYTIAGLAGAMGGLFISTTYYINKFWKKKK